MLYVYQRVKVILSSLSLLYKGNMKRIATLLVHVVHTYMDTGHYLGFQVNSLCDCSALVCILYAC